MKHRILKFTFGDTVQYLIEEDKHFVPLTERRLAKIIPHFLDYAEKAREKKFRKWLENDAVILRKAHIDTALPNAPRRLKANRTKHPPSRDDLILGAQTVLSVADLTPTPVINYRLLALIVSSPHTHALRLAAPSFQPILRLRADSSDAISVLDAVVRLVVQKHHWLGKHCTVQRSALLDYTRSMDQLPRHIQDHTQLSIKVKDARNAKLPFPYTDTLSLIIQADSTQLREAAPYLEDSGVILLNCSGTEFNQTRLSTAAPLDACDMDICSNLATNSRCTAALMRCWWCLFEDERAWAEEIIRKARSFLGKPDDRFIHFMPDPKRLRDAIYYQVLLSFLNFLEVKALLTSDELERYRQGAKDVFDPEPPKAEMATLAEDPQIFLDIMRQLVKDSSYTIVAEDSRFVKGAKNLGAWRQISHEPFLVMLEETWARAYSKAVRARKDIDTSLFQEKQWERKLQKLLVGKELIKPPSSGYRYRYDLFDNGTRDSTYVVAVPVSLLEI